MKTEVNPFSVPLTRKLSPLMHGVLKNFHMVPKVYALSRSYLDWDI